MATGPGHATDSDGKTEGSRRTISLDPFTVAALRPLVEMIEGERDAFGTSYPDHGMLMCFEDGRRLHPDTVTSRFNRLVDQAGVRRIRLHDVRHTYATLARDLGVNSKIVTDRLGHANETVTQQIYTHPSTGNDRPAAEMIARLIAEALGTDEADLRTRWSHPLVTKLVTRAAKTALQIISGEPSCLVAGAGFEPATSGL